MGEEITDAERQPTTVGGFVSEEELNQVCDQGPNGTECPTCASTSRPWYADRWRCPSCGHAKNGRPIYRLPSNRPMCENCFEAKGRDELMMRRDAAWRKHPMSPVDRALGAHQLGNLTDRVLRGMSATDRDELYSRASRTLRERIDKLEHPAGTNR